MKPSPVVGSSLVRARLLTTNCEVLEPGLHFQNFQAEMVCEVNVSLQDREKGVAFDFIIDMTVSLSLHQDDNEVAKAKCKFRGDYNFNKKKYSQDEIADDGPLFANQMLLIIRPYLANTLSAMGANPVMLPFNIPFQADQENDDGKSKKKKR